MKSRNLWWMPLGVFILAGLPLTTVQAATITVDAGGTCTLADAITAANEDAASGGCRAGSGDDTIILRTNVTLAAALPDITSTVVIKGHGHTVTGISTAPVFTTRLPYEDTITLNDLAITGGASGIQGQESGLRLFLDNVKVSGNGGTGINAETFVTVTLTNSIVSGNGGSGIDAAGGRGRIKLHNSTISGNRGAGIHADRFATITLTNSIVSGNSGTGIDTAEGWIKLHNSTVSGNGGTGIRNSYTSITLNHVTVSGNEMGIDFYLGASLRMQDSLVSGNRKSDLRGCTRFWEISRNVLGDSSKTNAEAFDLNSGYPGSPDIPGSTDIAATSDGTHPTALADILSPLAYNGGPTQTHALPKGSPAIDLDAECSTGLITDQRGHSRPVGAGCDAGSYERDTLRLALKAVTALKPKAFRSRILRNVLIAELRTAIRLVRNDHYASARAVLRRVRNTMNGCAAAGVPDRNDWIRDCANQEQVYPLIQEAIDYLNDMI